MKKYTLYILILLALIGLFGKAPKTHAQADFHCYDSAGVQDITKLNETDCTSAGKIWKQAAATPTPTGGGTTTTDKTYHYLAQLPGAGPTFDPTQVDANGKNVSLGIYLNIIIKLFIGICAVLAVVMIVVGGLEYMTSELVNTKEQGRHRISGAIFGLILALGAYTLLYTINPNLLNTDLSSLKNVTVEVNIQSFQVSGALSRNGTSVSIDFNSQAYPAAHVAAQATGVDEALVLAIFAQETSGGTNTGACTPANANMTAADQAALATIVGASNVATTNVSCSLSQGHGGAIGLTQFLPTTWLQYSAQAQALLGHTPDPWNTEDALLMTAVYLQSKGGATDPRQAACGYFGACSSGGVNYADQVMARMANIQAQIAQAKKDGKIP